MKHRSQGPMYIVLLAVLAGACSSATTGTTAPAASPTANEEFEALYRARQDSARMHFTEADVRFMNGMVHHHAQALEMARLVPDRTETSSIRILAARITNSQRDEIALMQQWLRRRNQTVPELHEMESGVMVHGGDHGAHMPGMLTAAQLAELAAARGPEFDRLFLTYMIQHHEGAVTMVHDLFGTDGAAQDEDAFRLASDVQVDQITEINRMKLMLSEMSPGGATP